MTEFYHKDILKSKWAMLKIEHSVIQLCSYEMEWLKLEAKIVWESGREIEDLELFWRSNNGNRANWWQILGHLAVYWKLDRALISDHYDITELLIAFMQETWLTVAEKKDEKVVTYTHKPRSNNAYQ